MKHLKLPLLRYFLLTVLLPYALLLGLGKYWADGPAESYGNLNQPMPEIEYALSADAFAVFPEDFSAQWMMERGIPQPPGSAGSQWRSILTLTHTNTWENHERFQQWVDETFGPGNWRFAYDSTLDLCFPLGDRVFGLEGIRFWEYLPDSGFTPVYAATTEIVYGYNGSDRVYWEAGGFYLSSQALTMEVPSELSLFLMFLLPATFLYFLRRPLINALGRSRRPQPPAAS